MPSSSTSTASTLPTPDQLSMIANQTTNCNGSTLRQLLNKKNPFKGHDDVVRRVFTQLIDAVQRLHDQGIFHRDITPENILISEDKQNAYLTGFGLATKKKMSHQFEYGAQAFMSPECIGTPTSHRTSPSFSNRTNDVWALGIILTLLITGKLPWSYAFAIVDPAYADFTVDPTSLFQSFPISEEVYHILVRIFDANPRSRINLTELRKEVQDVRTFFPDEPDGIFTMRRRKRRLSVASSSSSSDSSSTLSRGSQGKKQTKKSDKKVMEEMMLGVEIEIAKQMGVIQRDAVPVLKKRKWFGVVKRKSVLVC